MVRELYPLSRDPAITERYIRDLKCLRIYRMYMHLYVVPVVSSTMARWQVNALSTPLLHYNVVSQCRGFVTTELAPGISLAGRIATHTGCAGRRRVEKTV